MKETKKEAHQPIKVCMFMLMLKSKYGVGIFHFFISSLICAVSKLSTAS